MPLPNHHTARLEAAIARLESELDLIEPGELGGLVNILAELRHYIAASIAAQSKQESEQALLDRVLALIQNEDEALWLRIARALDD